MTPESNPTLEQWLSKATKNLAPQAVSSIKKEITDHFQTSLERYEKRGISRSDAKILVLRDLGDAEKSAVKFNHVYLTIKEEKLLGEIVGIPALFRSTLIILGSLPFAYIELSMATIGIDDNVSFNSKLFLLMFHSFMNFLMTLCLILFSFLDLLIIKNLKNNNLRILIKIRLITTIAPFAPAIAYMVTSVVLWGVSKSNFYITPGILAYYGLTWIKNTYPILRKLRPGTRASS